MKKPNITQGEWEINKEGTVFRWGNGPETDGYRPCIAKVSQWKGTGNGSPTSEAKANAKAISAVPDMMDALIDMKQFIENGVEFGYICLPEEGDSALDTISKINKALKKAGAL